MMKPKNDELQCPICSRENDCDVANGKDGTSCWCQNANINKPALNKLNSDRHRCICQSCVDTLDELVKEIS